jgi:predicted DCC family thiol-disulfide oxidoreductase YuxK
MKTALPSNKKIIIYDGYCPLCNKSVSFIHSIDKNRKFEFISRYSDVAKKYKASVIDSIILVDGDLIYYKSQAVLKIGAELGYPYKMVYIFNIFPKSWLNTLYDFVARNRSHWISSTQSCSVHSE